MARLRLDILEQMKLSEPVTNHHIEVAVIIKITHASQQESARDRTHRAHHRLRQCILRHGVDVRGRKRWAVNCPRLRAGLLRLGNTTQPIITIIGNYSYVYFDNLKMEPYAITRSSSRDLQQQQLIAHLECDIVEKDDTAIARWSAKREDNWCCRGRIHSERYRP